MSHFGQFAPDGSTALLMRADWNAGMSLAQIAAKYGIREAYVRGALLVLAIDGTFVPNDPTSI